MRVVSILVGSLALCLAGFPVSPPALAADCPPVAADADTPVAQLICRDPALTAATEALDAALAALGETTDAMGRAALDAGQTLWRARRDETCPVTAADLADAKATKSRTDCLLRVITARKAVLDAQREARGKPVADLPLVITDAAAPRLVPVPARPVALTRPVSMSALVGRWAKADPVTRNPIDDCRTSYLDVTRERSVSLTDPRIPGFPIEGRLAADTNPTQGVALVDADGATTGTLTLEPAQTSRLDLVELRMAPPATFAATFVRCR